MSDTETSGDRPADGKELYLSADFPCPSCNYNLRGLPAGRYVRCPECGSRVDLVRLRDAPAGVKEAVRRIKRRLIVARVAWFALLALLLIGCYRAQPVSAGSALVLTAGVLGMVGVYIVLVAWLSRMAASFPAKVTVVFLILMSDTFWAVLVSPELTIVMLVVLVSTVFLGNLGRAVQGLLATATLLAATYLFLRTRLNKVLLREAGLVVGAIKPGDARDDTAAQ